MKFITSTTLITALLVSGCASVNMASKVDSAKAKEFNAPGSGNAGLYVYRNSFVGKAVKKDIWLDGKCVGETAPDVFFYREVLGGKKYQLATESEFSPNVLESTLESNKNYFFRQYIKVGIFIAGAGIEQVSEEQGKKDISSLELAAPGKCTSTPPNGAPNASPTTPSESSIVANKPIAEPSVAVTRPVSSPSASVAPMPNAANETAAPKPATPTSAAMNAPLSSNVVTMPVSQENQIVGAANIQTSPTVTKIQLIEFALGVSSVTVERLAKEQSCSNTKGAGLVSPKGSHELYKMQCSDGRVLMAKCELRQCTVLSHK